MAQSLLISILWCCTNDSSQTLRPIQRVGSAGVRISPRPLPAPSMARRRSALKDAARWPMAILDPRPPPCRGTQVGTEGWSLRSNKGMIGCSSSGRQTVDRHPLDFQKRQLTLFTFEFLEIRPPSGARFSFYSTQGHCLLCRAFH
jgi:hypothetical protein